MFENLFVYFFSQNALTTGMDQTVEQHVSVRMALATRLTGAAHVMQVTMATHAAARALQERSDWGASRGVTAGTRARVTGPADCVTVPRGGMVPGVVPGVCKDFMEHLAGRGMESHKLLSIFNQPVNQ